MRIGLLTYHNANNFGAALQAYALVKFLNDNGVDAEYIDYTCESVEARYRNNKRKKYSVSGFIKHLVNQKRNKCFDEFRKKIKISTRKYDKLNIGESNKEYDAFIVGSDQVWNYELNGRDSTYLLDFTEKPKFAFSSSIGMESLDDDARVSYSLCLKDFINVYVRENKAKELLEDIGITNCETVLDPCFLLGDDQWSSQTNKRSNKEYIVYYTFDANNTDRFNRRFCGKITNIHRCKIGGGISLKDLFDPKTEVKYASGPSEFISLIKNAKLVVTDSFHATVFSIIFRKPFVTFYRNRPGKDARIKELLELTNLESREFSSLSDDELFVFNEQNFSGDQLESKRNDSRRKLLECLGCLNGEQQKSN